jgi:hypothetical protein
MIEPVLGVEHSTLGYFFTRAITGGENALMLFIEGFSHD